MAQNAVKALDYVVRNVDADAQWSRAVASLRQMSQLERLRAWVELSNRALGSSEPLNGTVLHSQYKLAFKRAVREADAGEKEESAIVYPLACCCGGGQQGVTSTMSLDGAGLAQKLFEALVEVRKISTSLISLRDRRNNVDTETDELLETNKNISEGELHIHDTKSSLQEHDVNVQEISELLRKDREEIRKLIDEKNIEADNSKASLIAVLITDLSTIKDIREILEKGINHNNEITGMIHSEFETLKKSMPQLLQTLKTEKQDDSDIQSEMKELIQGVKKLTDMFSPLDTHVDDLSEKKDDADQTIEPGEILGEIDQSYHQTKKRIKLIVDIYNLEMKIYQERMALTSEHFGSEQVEAKTNTIFKSIKHESTKIKELLQNAIGYMKVLDSAVSTKRR